MRKKGSLVPGWVSVHESGKAILLLACHPTDDFPGRTESSQPRSQVVHGHSASHTSYQLTAFYTPQYAWILFSLSAKTSYKQPVNHIIHLFIWSGLNTGGNYALDAE